MVRSLRRNIDMFRPIGTACLLALICAHAAFAYSVTECAQARDPNLRITACSELITQAGISKKGRTGDELGVLYRRRGSAYLETGKSPEAIVDFSEAIRLKPGYALAFYERGRAELSLGNRDRARADYDAAIQHGPRYWLANVSRGYLRLINGDFEGAIADFSRAIEIEPNNAVAFNNRGLAWSKKGDPANALADYSVAINLNDRYALAFANRGHLHEGLGKLDQARADFTMALSFDPTLSSAAAGLRRVGVNPVVTAESDHIVDEGRSRVEVNCSPCHAISTKEASPNPKAPPFRTIGNLYPMLMLRDPISRGLAYPHRDMPKFNFSGEEIDAIIAFISSLPASE